MKDHQIKKRVPVWLSCFLVLLTELICAWFLYCCVKSTFLYRYFAVRSGAKLFAMIVLMLLSVIIMIIYYSACHDNRWSLTYTMVYSGIALLLLLLEWLAIILFVIPCTGSKTNAVENWGCYDKAVDEVLERDLYTLFPKESIGSGTTLEYRYRYECSWGAPEFDIHVRQQLPEDDFNAMLLKTEASSGADPFANMEIEQTDSYISYFRKENSSRFIRVTFYYAQSTVAYDVVYDYYETN